MLNPVSTRHPSRVEIQLQGESTWGLPKDLVSKIIRFMDERSREAVSCVDRFSYHSVVAFNALPPDHRMLEVIQREAMEALGVVEDSNRKDVLRHTIAITHLFQDPQCALEWVRAIEFLAIKVYGLCEVATFFEREEAIALLTEAKELTPLVEENYSDCREITKLRVIEAVAFYDPALALDWIEELFPESQYWRGFSYSVISHLLEPDRAKKILSEEFEKEKAPVDELIPALASIDPCLALSKAYRFKKGNGNRTLQFKIAKRIYKSHPLSAREMLQMGPPYFREIHYFSLLSKIDPKLAYEKLGDDDPSGACSSVVAKNYPEKTLELVSRIFDRAADMSDETLKLCAGEVAFISPQLALELLKFVKYEDNRVDFLFCLILDVFDREPDLSYQLFLQVFEVLKEKDKDPCLYIFARGILHEQFRKKGYKFSEWNSVLWIYPNALII